MIGSEYPSILHQGAVLDETFSGAQEEQEDEDVSEEEDGEECNPEDDASSDDEEEEIPQANRETFLSKNRSLNSDSNQERTAAPNIIRITPGPGSCHSLHERREHLPRTAASAAVAEAVQGAEYCPDPPEATARSVRRKRCQFCPWKKDCKTKAVCCYRVKENCYDS
ncbi:hypothetical protein CRENBAI_020225 [Crenichthys baileyi]|uniref:Uncharacterized protein n=1 Tax=Crenichthys baileyi TaxID=28760 RepID=A0AAV9S3Z0_9TELE